MVQVTTWSGHGRENSSFTNHLAYSYLGSQSQCAVFAQHVFGAPAHFSLLGNPLSALAAVPRGEFPPV